MNACKQVIRRGIGAGGANTNRNGLPYEQITDLSTEYKVIEENKHYQQIMFHDGKDIPMNMNDHGA